MLTSPCPVVFRHCIVVNNANAYCRKDTAFGDKCVPRPGMGLTYPRGHSLLLLRLCTNFAKVLIGRKQRQ